MKFRNLLAVAATLGATSALAACGVGTEDAGSADTAEWSYTIAAGPDHPFSKAMAWYAEQLEERTAGAITITLDYGGALCSLEEALACVKDGRVDMANVSPLVFPSQLPLSGVTSVPFLTSNPEVFTRATQALYDEDDRLAAEWRAQGAIPLSLSTAAPNWIGTAEPLTSGDDVKGLRIRATGYVADAMAHVGFQPVSVPSVELHESLERGVLDAWLAAPDFAVDQSLNEVTTNFYDSGAGIYALTGNPTVSIKSFEALTPELQQDVLDVAAELNDVYWDDFYRPAQDSTCEAMKETATVVDTLPAPVVEEMKAYTDTQLQDKWIADAEKAGADEPATFLESLKERIAEFEADLGPGYDYLKDCAPRA